MPPGDPPSIAAADRLEAKARALLEKAARLRGEQRDGPTDEPSRAQLKMLAPSAPPAASTAALQALAVALLPHLRQLLVDDHRGGDLVDVLVTVPGPKRTMMAACRRGDIAGAVMVGRRWLAPRAEVEAWLRARGPRLVPDPDGDDDDLEAVRRSLATPGRRPGGRRQG